MLKALFGNDQRGLGEVMKAPRTSNRKRRQEIYVKFSGGGKGRREEAVEGWWERGCGPGSQEKGGGFCLFMRQSCFIFMCVVDSKFCI